MIRPGWSWPGQLARAKGEAELEGFLSGSSLLRLPSGNELSLLLKWSIRKAICAFTSGSEFAVLLKELFYFSLNGNLIHIQMNVHFHFLQHVEFCPHIEF